MLIGCTANIKDVANGKSRTLFSFLSQVYSSDIRFLIRIKTVNIRIKEDPSRLRPIDADLQVPDTSKFQKHTGWKPEITFEKTMQDLLDYWRERVQSVEQFLTR